ncbi:MAG: tyrosine-protein phosphatase [Clostridia bacterium]|nr:tyrosine-protein phosphatase [Clostridia bacterium]
MALTDKLTAIADAIRAKTGESGAMTPAQMPEKIENIPTGINPGEHEWQQTPTAVQNYIDYVHAHPYDPDDYTYTYVTDYAPSTPVQANEQPVGKAITTDAGVLEVGGYRKTVTAGSNTVYNVVPGVATPYALNASGEVKQVGTLKPSKPLRQIKCQQARNVRDLGGWACDGGTVAYGKIIRGGAVTLADRDVLVDQLGVRVDLNVYCQNEQLDWTESPLGSDIKFFEARNYNWYSLTHTEAWRLNIGIIFEAVSHNETLYFHCVQGADRTGTLAVMVLALLGVDESDINIDFELTSFYTRRTRVTDSTIPTNLVGLISAIKEFGNGDLMDGAVNFAASLGFTAAEINAFRASMIEGSPETVTPDVDTFTVTNSLTHATSDNASATAEEFQPYEAVITPEAGYVISSVQVLMGGVDVTDQVFSGELGVLRRSVQKTLAHCSANSTQVGVIDGQGYAAEITVDNGYTLDGATVSITMGGVDITSQVWLVDKEEA